MMASRPLVFSSTVLVGVLLPFKTKEWIVFFIICFIFFYYFFICYCLCLYNLRKPIVTNNIQMHLDVPNWGCMLTQLSGLCCTFEADCPLSASHMLPVFFLAVFRLCVSLSLGDFCCQKCVYWQPWCKVPRPLFLVFLYKTVSFPSSL